MTRNPSHPSLAAGRWQSLSLIEQLANLGSEVERAIRAHAESRHEAERDLPQYLSKYFLQFTVAARRHRSPA